MTAELIIDRGTVIGMNASGANVQVSLHSIHDGLWDLRLSPDGSDDRSCAHAKSEVMAAWLESIAHAMALAAAGPSRAPETLETIDEGSLEVPGAVVSVISRRPKGQPAHEAVVSAVPADPGPPPAQFSFSAAKNPDDAQSLVIRAEGPPGRSAAWACDAASAQALARSLRAAAAEVLSRAPYRRPAPRMPRSHPAQSIAPDDDS